jgi:DNA processing protein
VSPDAARWPEDFDDWFRLLQAPGLGRGAARRLLAAFGSPGAVLRAGAGAWREVSGAAAAAALAQTPAELAPRLQAAHRWLQGADDDAAPRHVLTLADPAYPGALLHTADPPLLLYLHGDPAVLGRPALALVGSRHATAQGLDNARAFATALGREGWVVVSGLALGIDAAAHEGALAAPAATVAVVGTGLDITYPARNAALAQRIVAGGGALLSEYAPGTPALAPHFPQRNRIIAGLSRGTLVVEAALRSGSLITARLASEAGREVFAIPGSIHAPQSRGCHALIRQGAKLVESAQDILEELQGWGLPATGRPALTGAAADDPAAEHPQDPKGDDLADTPLERRVLAALGHDPVTLDALSARTGDDGATLMAVLLTLELQGRVARLPGGLYQRRSRA